MKIYTLMENTSKKDALVEHGLSLYIEVNGKRILFDTGQSGNFSVNAENMGVDLTKVDFCVLSHGHYDHGDGLDKFIEINKTAPVYVNENAFKDYYAEDERYIGVKTEVKNSDRIIMVKDYFKLDENMEIFSFNEKERPYKTDSAGLMVLKDGNVEPDYFDHEQYLIINENGRKIVISGCSHKGILNIMEWTKADVLVGGFHFMNLKPDSEDKAVLDESGAILNGYSTKYYTCHCTGKEQFEYLKGIMKDNISYIASGDIIEV